MSTPRTLTYVRLSDVRPAQRNPRTHDLGAICASLTRFGFTDPLEVDERTGRLVSGHGRVEGLVALRHSGKPTPEGLLVDDDGEWLVPMSRGWASKNDAEAEAYIIAANKLTEAAEWNSRGLASMIEDVVAFDPALLDSMAMDADDLDELLRSVNVETLNGQGDPDAVTLPPALDPTGGAQTIDVPGQPGEDNPDRPLGDDDEGTSYEEDKTTCPRCSHAWVRTEDKLTVLGAGLESVGDVLRHGTGLLLSPPGGDRG